jgi:hypothetical protein
MYWDISLHIDQGRDPGPLANPAHYLILVGLFGIFAAGFLAVVLPEAGERPGRGAVRISEGWYAPVGGLAMLATSAFALTGFPLDDVWHRLFGQDVTLWGPTHLMLIGGAALTLIGQAALLVEGGRESTERTSRLISALNRQRYSAICGGFLVGLSTFQAEFDFGVPQFRLLFHPVLIAVAAALALSSARIYAGPRGALMAAVYFIAIRGFVSLLVGPVFGETTPVLPLYLVEALCVEAAALAANPARRRWVFGALSGALVGTVGFLAEYGYAQFAFPTPWPSELLVQGAIVVPLAGIAAGVVGVFVGTALRAPRDGVTVSLPAWPAAVGVAAIAAVVAFGLQTNTADGIRADVTLADVSGPPARTVQATVKIDPPQAADDADQLSVIAWQGGGFDRQDLKRVREGVYRTTEPIPVHGSWKTLIRLHDGHSLAAIPVYLPEDSAIPAKEVPASRHFTREFITEKDILQREAKQGVAGGLALMAYGIVGGITLTLLLILGWTLQRITGGGSGRPPRQAATDAAVRAPVRMA